MKRKWMSEIKALKKKGTVSLAQYNYLYDQLYNDEESLTSEEYDRYDRILKSLKVEE